MMTREGFVPQWERLCEGHRFQPTGKQTEAFYEFLQHADEADFRVAVSRLLAAARFPASVDQILRECDRAREDRRRAAVLEERNQAAALAGGKTRATGSTAMEQRYNQGRLDILRAAFPLTGKSQASVALAHVEGLADLLKDELMVEWMRQEPMGVCHRHTGDHSVFVCVTDELRYWILRAGGSDEVEAYRELTPLSAAPINPALMVRVDTYGRVKADQTGRIDPETPAGAVGEATSR